MRQNLGHLKTEIRRIAMMNAQRMKKWLSMAVCLALVFGSFIFLSANEIIPTEKAAAMTKPFPTAQLKNDDTVRYRPGDTSSAIGSIFTGQTVSVFF